MATTITEAIAFIQRELAPFRDRLSPEEERLLGEGRHREMAKSLLERARRRFGATLGLLVVLEFVPIVYVLFALLVFDLGPWEVVLGFLLLFLVLGLLPMRILVRSHRLYRSAARAWAVALEAEEERLPEEVDLIELVDRMDSTDRLLFEEGRTKELAERLEEGGRQGMRFSRIFGFVPLAALVLVGARWVAGVQGEGVDTLVLVPVALAFGAILYAVVRTGRESREKARIGTKLREALGEGS